MIFKFNCPYCHHEFIADTAEDGVRHQQTQVYNPVQKNLVSHSAETLCPSCTFKVTSNTFKKEGDN